MEKKIGRAQLFDRVQQVTNADFEEVALAVFRYQASANPIYAQFLELIGTKQTEVQQWQDIPCLPIQLFKRYLLQSGQWEPELVFTSSGTTGSTTSRHALRNSQFYRSNARRAFEQFYGPLQDFCVLALLPSYLERSGSSLVFMAQDFIEQTKDELSGFFLHDIDRLLIHIGRAAAKGKKVLLLGVSFALWDLAEQLTEPLPASTIVMETGGMKGRRQEVTRKELHSILSTGLGLSAVHSEYGMTELLSQAYSRGNGIFEPAASMRIRIREITDPFSTVKIGKAGAVDIIDLANLDTISFIATEDIGRSGTGLSFEILGRLDAGDVRGCNLLVQ